MLVLNPEVDDVLANGKVFGIEAGLTAVVELTVKRGGPDVENDGIVVLCLSCELDDGAFHNRFLLELGNLDCGLGVHQELCGGCL